MQKKAAKEQQIQEDKEKSKAEDAARWRIKGAKEAIEESAQSQGWVDVMGSKPWCIHMGPALTLREGL